jgi:hypothetical protein
LAAVLSERRDHRREHHAERRGTCCCVLGHALQAIGRHPLRGDASR